jgi:hypothetical protein
MRIHQASISAGFPVFYTAILMTIVGAMTFTGFPMVFSTEKQSTYMYRSVDGSGTQILSGKFPIRQEICTTNWLQLY